ncbi:unnamed protein product [Ectocarpus sp. 8 AP-2014]
MQATRVFALCTETAFRDSMGTGNKVHRAVNERGSSLTKYARRNKCHGVPTTALKKGKLHSISPDPLFRQSSHLRQDMHIDYKHRHEKKGNGIHSRGKTLRKQGRTNVDGSYQSSTIDSSEDLDETAPSPFTNATTTHFHRAS